MGYQKDKNPESQISRISEFYFLIPEVFQKSRRSKNRKDLNLMSIWNFACEDSCVKVLLNSWFRYRRSVKIKINFGNFAPCDESSQSYCKASFIEFLILIKINNILLQKLIFYKPKPQIHFDRTRCLYSE